MVLDIDKRLQRHYLYHLRLNESLRSRFLPFLSDNLVGESTYIGLVAPEILFHFVKTFLIHFDKVCRGYNVYKFEKKKKHH